MSARSQYPDVYKRQEYKLLSYMVVNPAQQYIDMALQENGNVDLDTQEFRATMAAYKRLVQSGPVS